jgi:hypothetical protein
MAGAPAAFLFAPPQPPLRLEEGREVVIGRSPDCDLPLSVPEASRRHAAVRSGAAGFVVRDLGSTNGTFVNGERVAGERALRPGDRIEIGSVSLTFCRADPALAATSPSGGERTLLFDRALAAPATALHGRLEDIPPFAVLQMLEMGAKSGLLTIEGDGGPVRLWLESGRPVHAAAEKTCGAEAALDAMRRERGSFRFEAAGPPPDRTLAASLTELLLEAARQSDEGARG